MVETAMIKVFASDQLWRITNDCLQIWGGAGFFTDQPFERMMRDARLNLIGEGANDVLRCFVAAVGLRHLGVELQSVLSNPFKNGAKMLGLVPLAPEVPVKHEHLRFYGRSLAKQIGKFFLACEMALAKNREQIINQQFTQARLGDIATELFMYSCVYARLTALLLNGTIPEPDKQQELKTGMLYMRMAKRRNEIRFESLSTNHDEETEEVANLWLNENFEKDWVLKGASE